ncbi:hypothetical protein SKAU_G00075240 [Synaphobranchus kaupii]|uniref:E3 ubiquitin-protein ligase n=1 Tax=Synaphobranchus kaupii TaxID=118154 RepID=A0A9Q1G8P4_SYNKA|nr:hypothetical protein SKAU_G00075240 [Synaphobranchus kaupii]
MGTIHHKEKWDCNQYLNGKGPPAREETSYGGGMAEAIKKEVGIVGDQPDGEMKWTSLPRSLPSHLHCGTIEIEYSFKNGIQTEKHPKPGKPFTGLRATAYLPDDLEGNELLTLLKRAFDQRLTFTVASGSGGLEAVTWSDIPHCTGFNNLDPHYQKMVKQVLKSKGID